MRDVKPVRALVWLTLATAGTAGASSFLALVPLRDDPLPSLAGAFRIAAFLQVIPYLAAAVLAVCERGRPAAQVYVLAAVVLCGAYGWWWLTDLADARRFENEPVRRNALGNIFPDLGGQVGAVEAFFWPVVVLAVTCGPPVLGGFIARRGRTAEATPPPRS